MVGVRCCRYCRRQIFKLLVVIMENGLLDLYIVLNVVFWDNRCYFHSNIFILDFTVLLKNLGSVRFFSFERNENFCSARVVK